MKVFCNGANPLPIQFPETKKAVKSDPGGRTQVFWTKATPEGSGSGLTAQFAAASTPSERIITTTFQTVSSVFVDLYAQMWISVDLLSVFRYRAGVPIS